MSRSRHALRLSSVLMLVACLGGQLASSLHRAVVRHVDCAEHGGVVELHEAGPEAPWAVDHDGLSSDDAAEHHAHCDLCALPAATQASTVDVSTLDQPHALPGFTAITVATHVRSLYRLAPKGSPPRSASI